MDSENFKHVLGLREGSSENSTVVTDLLNDLVERGVKPDRLRLFVIDESKALRCAMQAAFSPEADKDKKKLKQLAKWLEQEYPSAASNLLEGQDEMFTINALGSRVTDGYGATIQADHGLSAVMDAVRRTPHGGSQTQRVK